MEKEYHTFPAQGLIQLMPGYPLTRFQTAAAANEDWMLRIKTMTGKNTQYILAVEASQRNIREYRYPTTQANQPTKILAITNVARLSKPSVRLGRRWIET